MEFRETEIPGVFVVDLEKREDDRGFFARTWCQRELTDQGLDPTVVQMNAGSSTRRGTLRGVHYQVAPHAEIKFVSCVRGSLWDVALDFREDSPTFKRWFGVELSAENGRMLWIPEGCAHGYETLEDDTELRYTTSAFYSPESARAVRFDDPAFGIDWPTEVTSISEADRNWQDFPG